MAFRLSASSENTRGLKRDNNAKPAITPHWRITVMVRQFRQGDNRKLGQTRETVYKQLQFTYKQPASMEEVKACTQKHNESLRSYVQRWSIIKNSAVDVSDKRALDAFTVGLWRANLVKEMIRIKPKKVAELMNVANRFADCGDPAYHCITPMKHRLTSITSIKVVQQKHRRSKVGA
jgi:hypothetical protein